LNRQSLTQSDIFLMTATGSGQVHLVRKEDAT
jgi:hypothetical protein